MDELIISIFENQSFYIMTSSVFCFCLFAWFLGFGIRLVISILYNILNVT